MSGAYNAAAIIAEQRGCAWLLLLDDDTSVTAEFLRGMLGYATQVAEDERIAAVAPFLYAGTFCMSPRLWRFARHVPLPRPAQPYTETRAIFAANSGTLMRVRVLEAIGGYSARFWLDYSDIDALPPAAPAWIVGTHCRRSPTRTRDGDAGLRSANDAGALRHFLSAESDFMDLYRGPLERGMHLLRLAARVAAPEELCGPGICTVEPERAVGTPDDAAGNAPGRARMDEESRVQIAFDHQVTSLQDAGGMSRYHYELARQIRGREGVSLDLLLGGQSSVLPFAELKGEGRARREAGRVGCELAMRATR